MKCPQCGKDSNVTISNKIYCTSCGAVVSESAGPAESKPNDVTLPAPAEPAAEPPAPEPEAAPGPAAAAPRMTDIAVPGNKPAAPAAAANPTDRPVVTPITAARTMQDVMRPAAAYHNPAPAAEGDLKPITDHTATPVPTEPIAAPSSTVKPERLAAAQAVPKSDSIVKFHEPLPAETVAPEPTKAEAPVPAPIAAAPAPEPKPEPAPVIAAPEPVPAAPAAVPPAPAPAPAAPIVAAPAPAPAPVPEPEPQLPAPAVTQHEAMQNLVTQAPTSKEDAFKLAMEAATSAAKPNPMAVGAAALAVVVMGGYIWLQNYPRMQLSAVAGRAGFTASLPGYLPSSYKLDGPVQANPGQVSLHYSAPGLPGITISQKATSWDSTSLADNFVAAQDPSFSSVQGKGLTIYLFNNGQASWINHGIWYSITGASRLSQSELLKLAYSL